MYDVLAEHKDEKHCGISIYVYGYKIKPAPPVV